MKKLALILVMLFGITTTFAQKITVTPLGICDINNPGNKFIILTFENKSAIDLYNLMLKYVNDNKFLIKNNVDGMSISYETSVNDFPFTKNSRYKLDAATKYTTTLTFNNNEIKYEISSIIMKTIDTRYEIVFSSNGLGSYSIYNNKGELKRSETKDDIENHFNAKVEEIINYIKK